MQLSQGLAVARRSLGLILACTLLAAAAAWLFARSNPPRYTAGTAIAIESQTFAIPELQGAVRNDSLSDPMPLIRTEVQAIMSRDIVQPVIARLHLDRLPEFNPALRPETFFGTLQKRFARILAPSAGLKETGNDSVLNAVFRALVVSQDNRSFVIGVSFTSEDPVLAAAFVNDVVEIYVAARTQRNTGANRNANAEMLQRVDDVRVRLAKLQQQMHDLRTRNAVVGLRAGSIGQQQVEDLASAATKASLERAELEAQWKRAQILVDQGLSAELTSVLTSPTITRLREQESEASQRLADLQSRFGPNHPGMLSAKADLDASRGQVNAEARRIVAALAGELAVARVHEADAQRQLQAARDDSVKSENAQAQLNDLQQEVNAQRALYQTLLQGAQQTVAQASNAAPALDVRILSTAVPPANPSSPKTKLATAMGAAAGLILGFLLAFLRAGTSDVVLTAGELGNLVGAAVAVGAIDARRPLLARVRAAPAGTEAEGVRRLYARVRGAGAPARVRNVLFLGAGNHDAAADIAACLAYVVGGDGERTILVDADPGSAGLNDLLGVQQGGLLPVLGGDRSWRDVLLSDQVTRVDFLLGGRKSAAATLPGVVHFQNLLMDLQDGYLLAILAGASAMRPDMLALAREADLTVLVVRAGKDRRTQVRDAVSRIAFASPARPIIAFTGKA